MPEEQIYVNRFGIQPPNMKITGHIAEHSSICTDTTKVNQQSVDAAIA